MADTSTALSLIPAGKEDLYREFDAPSVLKVEIDKSTMYCGMLPITTISEDRQGEIIDPAGALLEFHRSSPTVCWQHSHKLAPTLPPIARAETPAGQYDVKLIDGVLYSGCTFSQATKLANQVFALINEGMVRCRSIGAIGHKLEHYTPEAPGQVMYQGKIVPARTASVIYRVWEMLEWSWVIIPANRDITIAVKSLLSNRKVDGQSIDPMLEMTLRSLDLREPVQVPGFSFVTKSFGGVDYKFPEQLVKGGTRMKGAAFLLFNREKVTPGVAKAFLAANPDLIETDLVYDKSTNCLKSQQVQYDGPVDIRPVVGDDGVAIDGFSVALIKCDQQMPNKGLKSNPAEGAVLGLNVPVAPGVGETEVKMDEVPPEIAAEEVQEFKGLPGSRMLQALAAQLDEITQMVQAALEEQEDPTVKSKASEIGDMLGELTMSVKELHDSVYAEKPDAVKLLKNELPEGEPKPEPDPEGEEAMEPDAEKRKSFLRMKFYRQQGAAVLPQNVVRALKGVFAQIPETAATKAPRAVLGQMLKGVLPQQPADEPMSDAKRALIAKARQIEMRQKMKGLVR
jgi:hypothetical protein